MDAERKKEESEITVAGHVLSYASFGTFLVVGAFFPSFNSNSNVLIISTPSPHEQARFNLKNPYLRLVDRNPPSIHTSIGTIHMTNFPDPKHIQHLNTTIRS